MDKLNLKGSLTRFISELSSTSCGLHGVCSVVKENKVHCTTKINKKEIQKILYLNTFYIIHEYDKTYT